MIRRIAIAILVVASTFPGAILAADQPAAASRQFAELLDEAWESSLREFPQFATSTGDVRYNDRLTDVSLSAEQRRYEANQKILERLLAIDRGALPREEQIHYDIFRRQQAEALQEYEFESHLMPITNRWGFHIEFPEMRRSVPLDTVADYENYIARLTAFGRYTDQHIELMRRGIEQEATLPGIVMKDFRRPIETHIVDSPEKSMFYEPLAKFPDSFAEADRERLRSLARKAIEESVVPAYRKFLQFMEDEYVPQARSSIAASALPQGRDYYRFCVKKFTTLDLAPEAVHETGLAEVKRIKEEMREIIRQVEFEGDFDAFVEHLRTDPKFYADTPKELLMEVSLILKRIDGKLPTLFGKLPRMPYGLREVPAYVAPSATAAYYMRPPGDGRTAGFYYINTYDLKSRPLYSMEALALHEAVPGHHMQLALQQELTHLPNFRRYSGFTAFIEGWALYAERLGLEVGFYEDPYQNFGRLNMEMWRACRLVVDTGIHYLGWSREQAIDFLAENSAMSRHNIRTEVDRYIAWPGQALAYKTGELKIRELRALAEQALGPAFDLRAFHDLVLGSGSVPLPVLEENVRQFIKAKSGSAN